MEEGLAHRLGSGGTWRTPQALCPRNELKALVGRSVEEGTKRGGKLHRADAS